MKETDFETERDPRQLLSVIIPSASGQYKACKGDADPQDCDREEILDFLSDTPPSDTDEPRKLIITHGLSDALSVRDLGEKAIALQGTAEANRFLQDLEEVKTSSTMILCLDFENENETGRRLTQRLRQGLDRLNIACIDASPIIRKSYSDPEEFSQTDTEGFKRVFRKVLEETAQKPFNTSLYLDTLMREDMKQFQEAKKTGFQNLDSASGGLNAGLYILAAPSSLGKTTFALQMADQLAEGGHDVIFFSLEQSRLELVSKSLARITAQANPSQTITSLSIRRGNIPRQVNEAAQTYKSKVSDRVSIVEGDFNCTTAYISDFIRQYYRSTGARPVVIIDYLQLLQPVEDKRQTTKEVVDTTVTTLRRLSREMALTIIAISSINRTNYLTPIDFESLKESGSIEYTADVVWGMQYAVIHDEIFDKPNNVKEKREKLREAKESTPRIIELVCLKNRYGSDYKCLFEYYPAQDRYEERRGSGNGFRNEGDRIRKK